ncbi:MAG: hypothetical protein M1401_06525 [Chloroflexi bacterium]|nr:hypothetical protein [Chloroflexota bacterium]MCL5108505.1 hypothetical protein [Chloroflexota bacterium]
MSIWKRLGSIFGGGSTGGDDSALQYAVKCRRCGEVIRVRVNRRYDLDQDFGDYGDQVVGYTLHKEVLGNRCPQLINIIVHYDRSQRETERDIEGGEFVPPDQA